MLPVLAALVMGERPGVQAGGGIALALLAIVLVSQQATPGGDAPGGRAHRSGLGLAFASGIAIGLFYLALARTSGDAGLWPLLAARLASALLFGVALRVARPSLRMAPGVLAAAVAGGVLDMLANLLYLLATRQGPLTLVVTLTSLYPASTVVLARSFLRERLAALQWVGVACALVAIVLIVSA
jgi:drug/metabolite transporter (DMT)-like permease